MVLVSFLITGWFVFFAFPELRMYINKCDICEMTCFVRKKHETVKSHELRCRVGPKSLLKAIVHSETSAACNRSVVCEPLKIVTTCPYQILSGLLERKYGFLYFYFQ